MGRYRLDIRKDVFIERAVKHWNRLLRNVLESQSPEVFTRQVDVAPEDLILLWIWQCCANSLT